MKSMLWSKWLPWRFIQLLHDGKLPNISREQPHYLISNQARHKSQGAGGNDYNLIEEKECLGHPIAVAYLPE